MGSCDWFRISDPGWQVEYSTWVHVSFFAVGVPTRVKNQPSIERRKYVEFYVDITLISQILQIMY